MEWADFSKNRVSFDSRFNRNICPQLLSDGFDQLLYGRAATQLQQPLTMSEDCLNLNIYARELTF
jgi:carboxylesterase type B